MTTDLIEPSDNLRGATIIEIGKPPRKPRSAKSKDTMAEEIKRKKSAASDGLLDEIDGQLRFARGIGLAVMGQAHIGDWDASDISELIDEHIRRLEYVREWVEQVVNDEEMVT